MHGSKDVLLRRYAHLPLLVVGQDDHVLAPISKVFNEVGSHVPDIVDASPQLAPLAKVVDSDKKSFPSARAFRILICIALWCAMAEGLGTAR